MLSDFFRINLPYGIMCDDRGYWAAFNREYQPIGQGKIVQLPDDVYMKQFTFVKYVGITDKVVSKLAWDGKMQDNKIFLYNDSTNPMNQSKDDPKLWEAYFERLKLLSRLKVAREY